MHVPQTAGGSGLAWALPDSGIASPHLEGVAPGPPAVMAAVSWAAPNLPSPHDTALQQQEPQQPQQQPCWAPLDNAASLDLCAAMDSEYIDQPLVAWLPVSVPSCGLLAPAGCPIVRVARPGRAAPPTAKTAAAAAARRRPPLPSREDAQRHHGLPHPASVPLALATAHQAPSLLGSGPTHSSHSLQPPPSWEPRGSDRPQAARAAAEDWPRAGASGECPVDGSAYVSGRPACRVDVGVEFTAGGSGSVWHSHTCSLLVPVRPAFAVSVEVREMRKWGMCGICGKCGVCGKCGMLGECYTVVGTASCESEDFNFATLFFLSFTGNAGCVGIATLLLLLSEDVYVTTPSFISSGFPAAK